MFHTKQFTTFIERLKEWNGAINLISPTDIENIWSRHIDDSCQLAEHIADRDACIVDIGSGAGFPGLILGILGYTVHLVEADRRKAIFLKEMMRELKVLGQVHNCRMEMYTGPAPDVLVARGFAPLSVLGEFLKLLRPGGYALFLKGKNYEKELPGVDGIVEIISSKVGDGVIIKMQKN